MKLVHLVGFIVKKFVTTHGHMNVKYLVEIQLAGRGRTNKTICLLWKILSLETTKFSNHTCVNKK